MLHVCRSLRLSLSEIETFFQCSGSLSQDERSEFKNEIKNIITKAAKSFNYDTGRVLELTNQTFEVGDNYQTHVNGATLACFVTRNVDGNFGPAAYASHVLASTEVLDRDFNNYNVSIKY